MSSSGRASRPPSKATNIVDRIKSGVGALAALLVLLAAVVVGFYQPVLDGLGQSLTRQDRLTKADAIVAPTQSALPFAVKLYQQHWAPILATCKDHHDGVPAEALLDAELCGSFAQASQSVAAHGWRAVLVAVPWYQSARAGRVFSRHCKVRVIAMGQPHAWWRSRLQRRAVLVECLRWLVDS